MADKVRAGSAVMGNKRRQASADNYYANTKPRQKLKTSSEICCEVMNEQLNRSCPAHVACPDTIVKTLSDGTYIIPIYDGGNSGIVIRHCPWCGSQLGGTA
jgi:hypothetical protein